MPPTRAPASRPVSGTRATSRRCRRLRGRRRAPGGGRPAGEPPGRDDVDGQAVLVEGRAAVDADELPPVLRGRRAELRRVADALPGSGRDRGPESASAGGSRRVRDAAPGEHAALAHPADEAAGGLAQQGVVVGARGHDPTLRGSGRTLRARSCPPRTRRAPVGRPTTVVHPEFSEVPPERLVNDFTHCTSAARTLLRACPAAPTERGLTPHGTRRSADHPLGLAPRHRLRALEGPAGPAAHGRRGARRVVHPRGARHPDRQRGHPHGRAAAAALLGVARRVAAELPREPRADPAARHRRGRRRPRSSWAGSPTC